MTDNPRWKHRPPGSTLAIGGLTTSWAGLTC